MRDKGVMAIINVFATQVYQARVVPPRSSLARELLESSTLIRERDQAGHQWSRANYPCGYTSYGSLDELHRFSSSFEKLKKKIDPHVARYARKLGFSISPRALQMTKMWVNIMGQHATHGFHLHPLSVISGSFYLRMPKGASAIKFEDPRIAFFMARPPAEGRGRESYIKCSPQAGDIILFESWLKHEVPPHPAETERVSISFNYDWVGS